MPSSSSSSSSSLPLIKGYLPVRVHVPSWRNQYHHHHHHHQANDGDEDLMQQQDANDMDETFFYCKEHFVDKKKTNNKQQKNCTLFVANAPCIPGVLTKLVLQSLLGRLGDLERVTVVENPRAATQQKKTDSFSTFSPSFLPPIHSNGRFAHVVFTSHKEMKRAWRALCDVMTSEQHQQQHLSLGKLEVQTLRDATDRIVRRLQAHKDSSSSSSADDNDESDDNGDSSQRPQQKQQTGILAVAERYRRQCKAQSRQALLEECNKIMQDYEDAEEEDRRQREASKNQPDEEGFITVSYSGAVGSNKRELDEASGHRKHGAKRSRKKKKQNAAKEGLSDFYRFQTKETRKKSLQDLRQKFEEDLAKVKRMKDQRQYKPF
jgi:ribosomal RNA-processing protein 7